MELENQSEKNIKDKNMITLNNLELYKKKKNKPIHQLYSR